MALIKEMLFNNGEGISHTDFNDAQRFMRAQLWDLVVGKLGRTADGVNGYGGFYSDPGEKLHVFGSDCAPVASATALRIDPLGGMIIQFAGGTFTGSDYTVYSYQATSTELQTLHDIGGANPRWDLVEIELTRAEGDTEYRDIEDATTRVVTSQSVNKRRNIVMTKTVTKGTEAANPTIPAPTANRGSLYAVYIPAAHNAVHDPANIFDYRMPLGTFACDVWAGDMVARGQQAGSGNIAKQNDYLGLVKAGAAADDLYFIPSGIKSVNARLLSVQALIGDVGGTSTLILKRFTSAGLTTLLDMSATLRGAAASGSTVFNSYDNQGNENGGLIQTRSGPVWINGHGAGHANSVISGTDTFTALGLEWHTGDVNDRIAMIRFNFAGGL